MTDNDSYEHFKKKVYEFLHLHYRHYRPLGKPEPIIYRQIDFELYKIWDSGVLEELSHEPILEEEVKQLDMFPALFGEFTAITTEKSGGTLFDQPEVKKT